MNTTLNNLTGSGGASPASISAICAPDLILPEGGGPQRVRVVHSMPGRQDAIVIEGESPYPEFLH